MFNQLQISKDIKRTAAERSKYKLKTKHPKCTSPSSTVFKTSLDLQKSSLISVAVKYLSDGWSNAMKSTLLRD